MIKKSNTLPVGHRLHQYRIEAVLGAGGFGITYKAVHEALQTMAAVKEYFPVDWSYRDRDEVNVLANTQGALPASEAGQDACYTWGLERFLNEARILARVNHPNVVRVRDFFEANGTAYIVMDYEDGEPLSRRLQRDKTLPQEQVLPLLEDLIAALEAVHAQGYLHRDIKPANLYRRADGRTILIDFGAARQALGRRSKSVTSVFSPGYSPIEQYLVDGKGYGAWTDIYAVGAVLYHCVTGTAPVEAPARVLDDPLKSAAEVAADRYPLALLRLVDRAMAVRPENRFQSMAEMRRALRGLEEDEGDYTVQWEAAPRLDERGPDVSLPHSAAGPSAEPPPGSEASSRRVVESSSQRVIEAEAAQPDSVRPSGSGWDWRWIVGGLVGIAGLIGSLALFWHRPPQPPGPPPASNQTPPGTLTVGPTQPPAPAKPQPGGNYTDPLTGMELVWIPKGCFTMGSPETETERSANEIPHSLCLSGFWLGKLEVTNAQYRHFVADHDSGSYGTHSLNDAEQPVVRVSWREAAAYAGWLAEQTGLPFRLPTEAEWEYAARAGKTSARSWEQPDQACRQANIYDETARQAQPLNWPNYPCEDGQVAAAPVGKYAANPFGVFDMLGNVAEWTCSEYDSEYKGGETRCAPTGAAGGRRVLRGGSWSDYPGLVRFAYRFPAAPEYRKFDLGFRLALTPPEG